jgi:hypothetical protein
VSEDLEALTTLRGRAIASFMCRITSHMTQNPLVWQCAMWLLSSSVWKSGAVYVKHCRVCTDHTGVSQGKATRHTPPSRPNRTNEMPTKAQRCNQYLKDRVQEARVANVPKSCTCRRPRRLPPELDSFLQ